MSSSRLESPEPAPWTGNPGESPIFVVIWATGNDPRLDGIFRIQALRRSGTTWEQFDAWVDPFPDQDDETASARMVREFGVQRTDLEGAGDLKEAWSRFRSFCGEAPILTPDAERVEAWRAHLDPGTEATSTCVGLTEVAALCFPGRLSLMGEGLVDGLCPYPREGPPAASTPGELRAALGELTRRFLAQDPRIIRVASVGYTRAWHGFAATDPGAARRLALALQLLDRPTEWCTGTSDMYLANDLMDGALSLFADTTDGADQLLEDLLPGVTRGFEPWADADKLPPERGQALPFMEEDRGKLDDLFRVHLPALISEELSIRPEEAYRESQHTVATRIADALGGSELLLMHAPTGTGKTMAYLLPALLWARRHDVRVGVATYTRALQEQAMDREVPRALTALARVGYLGGTRVSVLKGRENYLCFRSLKLTPPSNDDQPEQWLAWTGLGLFALADLDGDLDRFPRHAPVRLSSESRFRQAAASLVRGARARSGCCTHKDDRSTCAAELARSRAERSHLVLTNQSFALTRPEFLRHVVFDECEHLHDVAAGTWSHRLSIRSLRSLLERLHRPGGSRTGSPARAPLDRLSRQLVPGTPSHDELAGTLHAWGRTAHAIEGLERQARSFESWREGARRSIDERDEHLLFRRYLEDEDPGLELVRARLELSTGLGELETALGRLSDILDGLPLRGRARLRRTLDLARTDLTEVIDAVAAWIPTDGGRARLGRSLFHDLERDGRGELNLVAQVLLPGDVLGRNYYPDLETGIFLSAATKMRSGFDTAMAYLGLDRVEAGDPEGDATGEPVAGREVDRFSAPEVFDYSRVLVGAPRDVPAPSDKAAYLEWLTKFLLWLGERTRGRMLVLFTNLEDVRRVGEALRSPFRDRRIPLWYQGMEEAGKEELAERFRSRTDSVLLGVDTFWYGADFPGETLEYLILARLPYGVPDRYHQAQCAALGTGAQRERIYLPRALAKFRQGFGRLMRRKSDRGCVFILDRRITEARHRFFLKELPLEGPHQEGARLIRGDATMVLREALAHMGMLEDLKRRGLSEHFGEERSPTALPSLPEPEHIDISGDELPF